MITLPFPPSSLSGHNNGHWRTKAKITKQWRGWAKIAALAAKIEVQPEGEIRVRVRFFPPNNRSDRTNFANRLKPIFDGIADALNVNDRRFLPAYEYAEPDKLNPRIEIYIGGGCE